MGSKPSLAQWIKISSIATAVEWVAAVAQSQSVSWKLPYIMGTANEKSLSCFYRYLTVLSSIEF